LAAGAPLIIRGYTSAANDGGIGEIDCNGVTMFAAANYSYVVLADLYVHASINVAMVVLSDYCLVYHCEFYNASGSSDSYVTVSSYGAVMYCYVHGANTGPGISCFMYGLVFGNYIVQGNALSTGIYCGAGSFVTQNVVIASLTTAKGIVASNAAYGVHVIGNILYNTTAGTESGIWIGNATAEWGGVIMNNIVCGFSGVAGNAVENTGDVHLAGHNAFWNNTADYEIADQIHISLTANDVALAADPFTDAANGDFSLTAAAKTALAGKGFPTAYLGAHANTVPNLNIGPIQLAASSGGGRPAFGDRSGGKF